MAWLNVAPITPEAQAVIASHLAQAYPARGEEIITEYGQPLLALALLAGAAWAGRRFWKAASHGAKRGTRMHFTPRTEFRKEK